MFYRVPWPRFQMTGTLERFGDKYFHQPQRSRIIFGTGLMHSEEKIDAAREMMF